jgi:hypothetical protein
VPARPAESGARRRSDAQARWTVGGRKVVVCAIVGAPTFNAPAHRCERLRSTPYVYFLRLV